MRIAVTSQNKREVTGHAGRCRKFWIYQVDQNQVGERALLALSKEESFHETRAKDAHPLDDIDVLITAGFCEGLGKRLNGKGIVPVLTEETDPDRAVTLYLSSNAQH